MSDGLRERFGDRTALEWIEFGGHHEDDGNPLDGTGRFYRHFQDPTQDSWDTAGLEFLLRQYRSSARWMQQVDQDAEASGTGNWGWPRARQLFTQALTAPQPTGLEGREQAFADLFRALGQVMHLVVDASVPEHTRNDPHPMESILRAVKQRGYGNYEYWVSDQHGQSGSAEEQRFIDTYLSTPIGPDQGIFAATTGDTLAPVPIARLIDTKTYRGLNPNLTLAGPIGLAEFANANFFSEDTGQRRLFGRNYPFPDARRLVRADIPDPDGRIRAYFGKGAGDGLPAFPVLAECVLPGPPSALIYCTDEEVWKQVAMVMLPRAVGYASAVLDYFFRGRIEVNSSMYRDANGDFRATLSFINRTPNEVMSGDFSVHYDTPDGARHQLTTWNLSLGPDEESQGLEFPVPLEATPDGFLVVFRGKLGEEPSAVLGQWVGTLASWRVNSAESHGWLTMSLTRSDGQDNPGLGLEWTTWNGSEIQPSGATKTISLQWGSYFYRSLYAYPDDLASIWAVGGCAAGFVVNNEDITYTFQSPVTIELVELEAPKDLAALARYSWASPPIVKRSLSTFTAVIGEWLPMKEIDISGVKFFGIRHVTQGPAAPIPPVPRTAQPNYGWGVCDSMVNLYMVR